MLPSMMSVDEPVHSIARWPLWVRLLSWWLFIALLVGVAILYMVYSEDLLARVMAPWLDRLGCHGQEPSGQPGSCGDMATRLTSVTGFVVLIAYGRRLFFRVATVLGLDGTPKGLRSSQGVAPTAVPRQVASHSNLPWSQVRLSGSLTLVDGSESLFLVGEKAIYCWSWSDVPRLAAEVGHHIDAVCQKLPNNDYVLLAYRAGEERTVRVVGVKLMVVSLALLVGGTLVSWLLVQRTLMLGFVAFLVLDLVCIGLSRAAYRVLAASKMS